MAEPTSSRLSALQKQTLIILAVLSERQPGPVEITALLRMLRNSGDTPVFSSNLRQSCRRLEVKGLVRTLRASNQQLAAELTHSGLAKALPLLQAERDAEAARQRRSECRVLPVRQAENALSDAEVNIGGRIHVTCRADFVVRLDGTTCLQLWNSSGDRALLEGDALQVASWYETCFRAGLAVRVQVNEGSPHSKTRNRPG